MKISYSEAAKKGKMVANLELLTKELYSKECVAESINFVVEKASHENISEDDMDKISCNIATILARDQEVVAVWLKLTANGCTAYLSKNFAWLPNDIEYINKVTIHLG